MREYLYVINYNEPSPMGVYALTNVKTGWHYVGSSKDLTARASQHFRSLEDGTHFNRDLQYSFNESGAAAFSFIVLERCPEELLTETEQKWLNRLKRKSFNKQMKVRRPEDLEEMIYVTKQSPNPSSWDNNQ